MTVMSEVAAGAGHYVHWGVISISLTNLSIILILIAVFILAILVPMGGGRRVHAPADPLRDRPSGHPVDSGDEGRP
jgi:hypothetical protein